MAVQSAYVGWDDEGDEDYEEEEGENEYFEEADFACEFVIRDVGTGDILQTFRIPLITDSHNIASFSPDKFTISSDGQSIFLIGGKDGRFESNGDHWMRQRGCETFHAG